MIDIKRIIRQLQQRDIGILITDHNVRETWMYVNVPILLVVGEILTQGDPIVF